MKTCNTCKTRAKCLLRKYAYKVLKQLLLDGLATRELIIYSDDHKGVFYKLKDLDIVLALDCEFYCKNVLTKEME